MKSVFYWSVIGLIAASSFSAEGSQRMLERAAKRSAAAAQTASAAAVQPLQPAAPAVAIDATSLDALQQQLSDYRKKLECLTVSYEQLEKEVALVVNSLEQQK